MESYDQDSPIPQLVKEVDGRLRVPPFWGDTLVPTDMPTALGQHKCHIGVLLEFRRYAHRRNDRIVRGVHEEGRAPLSTKFSTN